MLLLLNECIDIAIVFEWMHMILSLGHQTKQLFRIYFDYAPHRLWDQTYKSRGGRGGLHPTHIHDDDDDAPTVEEEERQSQNNSLQWMGHSQNSSLQLMSHLIISMSHSPFTEIFDSTNLKPINAKFRTRTRWCPLKSQMLVENPQNEW